MIECASPGCQGRIEDGFCGVCGLAPVSEPPPATLRQQPFPPPPGPAGPPGPPDSGVGRRPHSGPPSPPSHPASRTGIPGGHIVMEYVGGKSLRELLIEKREQGSGQDVLPIEQVIAYGLECLRALGYPHSNGLLHCDFKPDKVIQNQELIKLIDPGGGRRMDDGINPVYTTPGYRVPEDELRGPGPSISADLYSVGWTLAVLSFDFGFIREHPHSLPPRHEVPLLQRFESYERFLRRATHRDPEARFHDAGDMADQLTGVLRAVLSEVEGVPHPAASALFGGETFTGASDSGVRSNLERRYRSLDHRAGRALERYELIDKANSLRPVTLL